MKAFGDSLERPRLRVALERSDEQSATLLTNVEGSRCVPKYRQFHVEGTELFDRLRDQELVLERHDREIDPDHTADLPRPLASGIDDDVSSDHSLRGRDEPPFAGSLDRRHWGVHVNLRSAGASSRRERSSHVARIDVTVCREVGRPDDTVQIDEREELTRSLRRDDLERDPQQVGDALPVVEVVEAILVADDEPGQCEEPRAHEQELRAQAETAPAGALHCASLQR